MKKWAAGLAVLAVVIVAASLYFEQKPTAPVPPAKIEPDNAATAAVRAKQAANAVGLVESNSASEPQSGTLPPSVASSIPAGQPSPAQITNIEPAIVLQNMGRAIRQYGQMFGGNPVGTNPEITRQLTGDNPKHINFLNPEAGLRVNDKGELIDPWGRPYFFHQLSAVDMEIHSAGPDGIMWTSDDLVLK